MDYDPFSIQITDSVLFTVSGRTLDPGPHGEGQRKSSSKESKPPVTASEGVIECDSSTNYLYITSFQK